MALGTAQFGLPYGIANQGGQVSRPEATAILDHAWEAGVDTLDTAIAYGDSESRLGEIGVAKWSIISKLPAIPDSCDDVADLVQESVKDSLERLRIPKLHGLLLHRAGQLAGPHGDALFRALVAVKESGRVDRIGVSIYGPEELDILWPQFQFDVVQAPFNILDRRLATSGWLARLLNAGTEVHARSVFLQGLLLMDAVKRPPMFAKWQPLWQQWERWLAREALTPLQASLGFVLSQPEFNRVIVGVESLQQLREVLACAAVPGVLPPSDLMSEDQNLINPTRWNAH